MNTVPRSAKSRPLMIVAQDPSVLDHDGEPLLTSVDVPAEELAPGPCGYRVRVIDYDSSTGTLYQPLKEARNRGAYIDQFAGKSAEELLKDPQFHQQNVYAITMRTLGRFEFALGRRVSWQFDTHQLKIVPHAFREANAFYSRDHEALLFGYFAHPSAKARKQESKPRIYTCLSHDVVAHEATHAILDGLRERFLYPSLPDQPAFHEGFADLVAILSVISVSDLVESVLMNRKNKRTDVTICDGDDDDSEFHPQQSLEDLQKEIDLISPLVSLAEQMGRQTGPSRGKALRDSLRIKPDRTALTQPEFEEPHRRGELLVAAVLRAVLKIAKRRVLKVGVQQKGQADGRTCRVVSIRQLAESFAKTGRDILNICIRGLDYVVPVHITFGDYLAAILTADYELVGNDSSYGYRKQILESFAEYGISSSAGTPNGILARANLTRWLHSEKTDHRSMMFNSDEMFRYLWENREPLQISDAYYTRVNAVNPTVRVGPDGMMVSETVVEYVQSAKLRGDELHRHGFRRPLSMPKDASIKLYGGGTLIFDVRGQLKYHIGFPISDPSRQNPILEYQCDRGGYIRPGQGKPPRLSFSSLHEQRAHSGSSERGKEESWQ